MLRSVKAHKMPLRCRLHVLRKDNKGATAIEFAIVAPVLFLLIFGIIEFGLMMSTQSALDGAATHAARTYKALARSGNPGANTATIHGLITQYGSGLVDPSRTRVVARRLANWGTASMPANRPNSNSGLSGSTSEIIQYRVYYDYYTYTPFLSQILGGQRGVLTLRASTVVQNEPAIGAGGGV